MTFRSLHAGKRAATIMSLIRSAPLNGHAPPYAYLKDVLGDYPLIAPTASPRFCRIVGLPSPLD